jgi:hypothetical protein
MRTLGFHTHVLMAIAAAAGLVATLSRPWYAAAPAGDAKEKAIGDLHGPLDGLFHAVERWVTETSGSTGWQSLDQLAVAMAAMAGVAAFGALLCLAPALQGVGRELVRYGALAAFAVAAWKLIDPPGSNAATELRYGAFAAVACATVVLTAGMGVANAPLRRRRAPDSFAQPSTAVYQSSVPPSGSVAPPGL